MALRWGIAGPGGIMDPAREGHRISVVFAQDVKAVGLDLVAVGSRSLERAERFAATYDVPRAHGSYEALAADPDVDAVYISTPHSAHAEVAEILMRGGKHVLIEKPMALNAKQVRRIKEVAAETGVFAMEAMRTRFMPHSLRIHELIASGALGEIQSFIAEHSQLMNADPAGRMYNPDLGGGALLDLGVYNVSFASDFLGTPTAITARGTLTETGVDLETSAILEYANGAHAILQTGMNGRGPNRASIVGSKARIEVSSVFYKSSKFQLIDGSDRVLEDFHEPYDFMGKQFEAWEVERCVAEGLTESPRMTLDESIAIHETMDEIRRQIGVHYPADAA